MGEIAKAHLNIEGAGERKKGVGFETLPREGKPKNLNVFEKKGWKTKDSKKKEATSREKGWGEGREKRSTIITIGAGEFTRIRSSKGGKEQR